MDRRWNILWLGRMGSEACGLKGLSYEAMFIDTPCLLRKVLDKPKNNDLNYNTVA